MATQKLSSIFASVFGRSFLPCPMSLRFHIVFFALFLAGASLASAQNVLPASRYVEVQQRAIQAQKPFLLICGKEDCPFTKKTLDEVLRYQPLWLYIQDNFVAGYLDIAHPDNWQETYHYGLGASTPTFLIFQSSGKLEYRFDAFMTQEQLYDSLIAIVEMNAGGVSPFLFGTRSETVAPSATDDSEFEREAAPMPAELRQPIWGARLPNPEEVLKQIAVSEPRYPATQSRNVSELLNGLERFDIQGIDSTKAFGLLYSRPTNRAEVDTTIEYLSRVWLNKDMRKNDVWIYLTPHINTPEYNVILGSFNNEDEARMFANLLKGILKTELQVVDLLHLQP